MATQGSSYRVRFGWDPRSAAAVAVCVLFAAAAALPAPSAVLRVALLTLFGGGALVLAADAFSRKEALRVDAWGIVLGGGPLRYRATTRKVPWAGIEAVVLFEQQLPYRRRMLHVGLACRTGAPVGRAAGAVLGVLTAQVPPEVAARSAAVNGRRLDERRPERAVGDVAPPGVEPTDARRR